MQVINNTFQSHHLASLSQTAIIGHTAQRFLHLNIFFDRIVCACEAIIVFWYNFTNSLKAVRTVGKAEENKPTSK